MTMSGPRSVTQGERVTYRANIGKAHYGRLAVLEETTSRGRVPLALARVGRDGKAVFITTLPVVGHHQLQVRVVRGQSTAGVSASMRVNVVASRLNAAQRREQASEAAAAAVGGQLAYANVTRSGSAASRTDGLPDASAPTETATDAVPMVAMDSVDNTRDMVTDAERHSVESRDAVTEQFLDSAGEIGEHIGVGALDFFVDFGLDALMSLMFPEEDPTLEAIQELTNEMAEDFARVDSQLDQIESGLQTLQSQVQGVASNVAQANASAAAANCSTLMSQANGYINSLQVAYDNYQNTIDPAWLNANLPAGDDADARIRVVGNQVFGTGSGTPSFLQGLNSVQQTTKNLANLLSGIGLPPGNSLIDACSSAVSASIAVNASAVNGSGFVSPIGAVDQQYFKTMQRVTSYYVSWANIGQFLSTTGSHWAILMVDPTPPLSADDAQGICAGVAPASSGSVLTCPGLVANLATVNSAITQAWNKTGGSWQQVSNGAVRSDARVDASTNYIIPARSAWMADPGTAVGAANIATNTFPAAGLQYQGLSFTPADSGQWNTLLQLMNQPAYPGATGSVESLCGSQDIVNNGTVMYSCTAPKTMGELVSDAGLRMSGGGVTDFIFTGESSTWDARASAIAYQASVYANSAVWNQTYGQWVNQPVAQFATPWTFTTNAFIDPGMRGNNGFSAVVQDPMGGYRTLGISDLYPFIDNLEGMAGRGGLAMQKHSNTHEMFGSCASTETDKANHFIKTWGSGASRLWAQHLNLPTGSVLSVDDGNCQGTNITSKAQVSNNTAMYGWSVEVGGIATVNNGPARPPRCSGTTLCPNDGPVNVTVTPPAGSPIFTPFSSATAQGIMWPAKDLTDASCLASGTLSGWTSFSQGIDGHAGATQMCQQQWAMFKAATLGMSTGSIRVLTSTQKTGWPTGQQATVQVYNYGPATTSTLYLTGANGIELPGTVTAVNGSSATVTSCQPGQIQGVSDTLCTVTLPNGYSTFSVPLTYLSGDTEGSLTVLVSDWRNTSGAATSFAGGTIDVIKAEVVMGTPPAPPVNLAVSPVANTTDQVVATWTAPSADPAVSSYTMTITDPSGTTTRQSIPASALTVAGNSDGQDGVTAQAGGVSTTSSITGYFGSGQSITNLGSDTLTSCTGGGCNPWTATVATDGTVTFTSTVKDALSTQYLYVNGAFVYASPQTSTGSTWSTTLTLEQMGGVGSHDVFTTSRNWRTPGTITITADTTDSSSAGTNSDMQVTTTLTLPSTKTGQWRFSLTAENSVGTSLPASVSAYLGQGPPGAVQGLRASERANGSVTVTWNAVQASPAVSGYLVSWQGPDGQWFEPVTVTGTEFSLPQTTSAALARPLTPGTWSFQVQAKNAQGTGPKATTQVKVIGAAPTAVGNLDVSISGDGMISAKWNGADAVPAPSKYSLAIYGPDAPGTAILTQDFTVTGVNSMVNIPNFFQIGNDTKPGMYTVLVAGANDVGTGESAQSSMYISQATINHSTAGQIGQQILGSLPASFHALAAAQCQAGLWQSGYLVFGTCDQVNKVFTSAPGLPPITNPTPLPGAQPLVGAGSPSSALSATTQNSVGNGGTWKGTTMFNGKSVTWTFVNSGSATCWTYPGDVSSATLSCPQITNVVVDANGNLLIGVKNRETGNTGVSLVTSAVLGSVSGLTDGVTTTVSSKLTDWFGTAALTSQAQASFQLRGTAWMTKGTFTLSP